MLVLLARIKNVALISQFLALFCSLATETAAQYNNRKFINIEYSQSYQEVIISQIDAFRELMLWP